VKSPSDWFSMIGSTDAHRALAAYYFIFIDRSPAFSGSGYMTIAFIFSPVLAYVCYLWDGRRKGPVRDTSDLFGSARFATDQERAAMAEGLELGIDPATGRAVRVSVQGTLTTIAPPRKGKTSGLLIPNLAFPEPQSWGGPAVVLDPKGEVHRATAARRRALGRRVICLDPLGLVGGQDTWNPLAKRDPNDILYLQHTALALLPEATGHDEASAYFRNRAVDLITGAIFVALHSSRRSVVDVQRLIVDEELLLKSIRQLLSRGHNPVLSSVLELLGADPKTKDPIKSTASQAFQWLGDERLRQLVNTSTFELSELASGEVDLFVAIPPEYKKVLAPFLRWFMSDLFTAIRRNRPKERVIIFVDEAAVLGRFDELLTAAGELPGYGASLWTMWQDRSQLVSLYGEAGAATLLNTAEIVTIFDMPAVDPDESERWSRAIGDYTAFVETANTPTGDKASSFSTSRSSQNVRLLTKEALSTMSSSELIVFPNSGTTLRHPLRLRKTVAHTDPRFRRLIVPAPPVGAAR
jgi:type IV secretion system protein VirD4